VEREGAPSVRRGEPSGEVWAATSPTAPINAKCATNGGVWVRHLSRGWLPSWECATSQEGRTSLLAHAQNQIKSCPLYPFDQ
jgi:hypothetical protein